MREHSSNERAKMRILERAAEGAENENKRMENKKSSKESIRK